MASVVNRSSRLYEGYRMYVVEAGNGNLCDTVCLHYSARGTEAYTAKMSFNLKPEFQLTVTKI